jgi:hypothetical protein
LASGQVQTHRIDVIAPRGSAGESVVEVRRAVEVVNVLRAKNDPVAQLASYKARRELAEIENRDPELLAALDKLIAELMNPSASTLPAVPNDSAGTWTTLPLPPAALTERERQILASDPRTDCAIDLSPPPVTEPDTDSDHDIRLPDGPFDDEKPGAT